MDADPEPRAAGLCSPPSRGPGPPGPCTRTPGSSEGGGSADRSLRRTPVGPFRKLNASFKSPSLRTSQSTELDAAVLQTDLEDLRRKCEDLDRQITGLISEGYSLEELDQHIDQLHEYNDIKDVGQILLGKLVIRGVTTRDLYSEFGLDLED
ncbi:DNA repair protein SWI5 homolog isoform X2 [Heptranchias perlo]|uniref:DNA repair protein SWI5 homolog isoform X2 n=1 Tax=Heptranchias perlo TaxID=212740 RepID=UPI003559FD5B